MLCYFPQMPPGESATRTALLRGPHLALRRVLQVPGQAEELERLDDVPGGVDLVPLEAVPAGLLEGVVVVVPALAEGQDADDPVVHRDVARVPVLVAPHVAHRVHRPGDVPHPDHPEEEAPEHTGQTAEPGQAHNGEDDGVQRVGVLQHLVEPLA